jgi:hypothetical protein
LNFFPNPKIGMLTKEKFIHLYTNNIQVDWTPIESIIKNIRIEKNSILYHNKNLIFNSINNIKKH